MAKIGHDNRITQYMAACMESLDNRLRGQAKVQYVAMGFKEKKPDGIYRTNRVLSGKKKTSNLIGLKIVDRRADGTMFVLVNYNPSYADSVNKSVDELCGRYDKHPAAQLKEQEYSAVGELEYYVDILSRNVECVRRLRKGPVKRTNGMYPDGLHICSSNEDGIGVIAVEGGYGLPIYLAAVKGKGQELENMLRQGRY